MPFIYARELRAHFGGSFPKPKKDKRKRTRTHEQRMSTFRDAVWERLGVSVWVLDKADRAASCHGCGRTVYRRHWPFGAVDHIRMRSTAPEAKYDPSNAAVLCQICHSEKHRIEVTR